ncbi:hypothetical protein AMIS_24180 [Actinoplanes missouriensis 431]|uniref:Uncharacterized protein n=2 Tax=Actinoplanes missouriensis TaxID=1866 RepID=I0H3Q1_ACTM4|nr:hypothetical protein AMIS_24180 [Actinoplanes missouriensis 431]
MFGDLFTGIVSSAPAQFGSHNEMHNYLGRRPLDPIVASLPDVDGLMSVYVRTDSDGDLDRLLSQRHTACLAGARNSGRYSAAQVALSRRHDPARVYEIVLPTDVSPEVLVSKPDKLPVDSGFVLRLPGTGHVDAMRKLAALFRGRSSTLLLIKEEETARGDRPGAEMRHAPPDPIEVFRSHLAREMRDEGPTTLERYQNEEVEAAVKATYGPKECVAIARAIAHERPVGAEALRALLERSQPKRRERAAEVLLPDADRSSGRNRRAGQHERAFRLSYAVFYHRPMHYVFEAADWLLREIDSAALRPDWGSMALQYPVTDLLGDALKRDWEEGREAGVATLGASRIAWIRDGGLRGAIIDVAWHEFDGTRRSLLRWLDRLVVEGDEVMQRAAAETAGLLTHYDFARIHEDLVDKWAASPKQEVRQVAAWTMTLSDMAGDVGPMVRKKLSEWCSGSSNYQRDTAARVYASGLQQTVLAWSMYDLARIARNKYQKRRYAVAEAVNQLYSPDRAAWIVAELADWARDPLLQVHAARALLVLAAQVEHGSSDGQPDVLLRLAEGSVELRHLSALWLVAFLDPTTAVEAGRTLARWIRHADANDEFRDDIIALLESIRVSRNTALQRITFYLSRHSGFGDGLPDWMTTERRKVP